MVKTRPYPRRGNPAFNWRSTGFIFATISYFSMGPYLPNSHLLHRTVGFTVSTLPPQSGLSENTKKQNKENPFSQCHHVQLIFLSKPLHWNYVHLEKLHRSKRTAPWIFTNCTYWCSWHPIKKQNIPRTLQAPSTASLLLPPSFAQITMVLTYRRHRWLLPVSELSVHRIIDDALFCIWLLSLPVMIVKVTHVTDVGRGDYSPCHMVCGSFLCQPF